MNTKLTLNVDSVLVQKAKSYAKDKGRSLSDLGIIRSTDQ